MRGSTCFPWASLSRYCPYLVGDKRFGKFGEVVCVDKAASERNFLYCRPRAGPAASVWPR